MMDSSGLPFGFGLVECLLLLIMSGVLVIPFWRIFAKAGYPGALALLMMIPLVNLVLLYFLAFADWPSLRGRLDGTAR
jgi:hypothetical protein